MITYWVLDRHFVDDHDRAIRFVDPPSATKIKSLGIPKDSRIQQTWCDKCSSWHLTLPGPAGVPKNLTGTTLT
jgi:hypothetical protein